MITWKDIFINSGLFIILYFCATSSIELPFFSDQPFFKIILVLTLIAVYYVVIVRLKNKKRIAEYLIYEFSLLNYVILSERPLTFKEQYENFEFDFGPTVNGISLNIIRYKNKMKRIFIVKNEKEHQFELTVTIIQTWRDKIRYKIDNTSRIRN